MEVRQAMRDLLNLREAAEMCRTPEATMRYWRHLGTTGPKSFRVGRRVFYRRVDVAAWLDEQYAAESA